MLHIHDLVIIMYVPCVHVHCILNIGFRIPVLFKSSLMWVHVHVRVKWPYMDKMTVAYFFFPPLLSLLQCITQYLTKKKKVSFNTGQCHILQCICVYTTCKLNTTHKYFFSAFGHPCWWAGAELCQAAGKAVRILLVMSKELVNVGISRSIINAIDYDAI